MTSCKINVFFSATSYPRSQNDWQGLFIKNILSALAEDPNLSLKLWAPDGPRPISVDYDCSSSDQAFLKQLTNKGGIANLLRTQKILGVRSGLTLLNRLYKAYRRNSPWASIYHINWFQNALPLLRLRKHSIITILGTDFKLLSTPGMVYALRKVLQTNNCILAPNAEWMERPLEKIFGNHCEIITVPFGVDDMWYQIKRHNSASAKRWLVVSRITADKMGYLFDWGGELFADSEHELHLFGPNQENLLIPSWVKYHGPTTANELSQRWFPNASGLVTLSQHSEGRPQVMLEAMASGLPIIASDVPAHRDFIRHKHTGYCVKDAANFKSAIEWVSEPANNELLSENSRNFAKVSYGTWRDCAKRYINLYQKLIV